MPDPEVDYEIDYSLIYAAGQPVRVTGRVIKTTVTRSWHSDGEHTETVVGLHSVFNAPLTPYSEGA